jgi:hypothetical protein
MSKKYQYFANKRRSQRYFDAITPCKYGRPGNTIKCHMCLRLTGWTRQCQQEHSHINQ